MIFVAHIRENFAAAFSARWAEWVSASTVVYCGAILRINPDLMSGAKTDAYKMMLVIADQATWSMFLILFGVVRLIVLLINGAWRRSPHMRALMAFLTIYWWTTAALSLSVVLGLGFAFACGLLVLDFGNTYRAVRDARTVDDTMRAVGNGRV